MYIVSQLKKLFTKKPKVIVVLGATSTGKSDLAVDIAHQCDGEIISADSRQVYRGMDLGSGKITIDEMRDIPHHLLDVADPSERFNAHDFKKLGEKSIIDILSRKKTPIICGGTGFYIDTLLSQTKLAQVPPNPEFRSIHEAMDLPTLQSLFLKKTSKKTYARIDTKNKVRIVRALEIINALGHLPKQKKYRPYNVLYIGLVIPQDDLYKRVYNRIIKRIDLGMITEVKALLQKGVSHKRLHELGLEYRHVSRHLQGLTTKDQMIEDLLMDTKHFIKRQKTWFKRNKQIHWFNPLIDIHREKIENLVTEFTNKKTKN